MPSFLLQWPSVCDGSIRLSSSFILILALPLQLCQDQFLCAYTVNRSTKLSLSKLSGESRNVTLTWISSLICFITALHKEQYQPTEGCSWLGKNGEVGISDGRNARRVVIFPQLMQIEAAAFWHTEPSIKYKSEGANF